MTVERVLAQRPVDPVAAAAVLERAVAACRSDPPAADRWHEPEMLDELVDGYEQLGRTDEAIAAMRSATAAGWRGRPDGRCRIAELLMRAGRVDEAGPAPGGSWLLGAAACLVAHRPPRLTAADRDLLAIASDVGVIRQ